MTKAQQKQIISVIRKDASLRHEYYDPETNDACVIGGLALAAGVSKDVLVKCKSVSISSGTGYISHVVGAISMKFGLDRWQMRKLQTVNDGHNNKVERRMSLVEQVRRFNTTPTAQAA